MKDLSTELKNLIQFDLTRFLKEPLSKQIAIDKIKDRFGTLPFDESLIKFVYASIIGGNTLRFAIDTSPIIKELKLNYDTDPDRFRTIMYACEGAQFKLDRSWFDVEKLSCVKVFYTSGIEIITKLNDHDIRSNNHYLKVIKILNNDPRFNLDNSQLIDLIYFN